MNTPSEPVTLIGLGAIFTLMFVMLGPLKIIGPFTKLTHELTESAIRQIALRAFAIGLSAVLVGGFGGRALLAGWGVSVPALLLTGGIIFFLVGLRVVLEQYAPTHPDAAPLPPSTPPLAAAMRITFPMVVTPYGTATVIVLLANSHSTERTLEIVALVSAVMLLNLLAMLYARQLVAGVMAMVMEILGAVLGVLQVAMAVSLIVYALRDLGVLNV